MKTLHLIFFLLTFFIKSALAADGNLTVHVFADKPLVYSTEAILWNVVVTNHSETTSTNTRLRVTLPLNIGELFSYNFNYEPSETSPFGTSLFHPGNVVSWSLGSLAPGGVVTFRITTWPSSNLASDAEFTMSAQLESDMDFETDSFTALRSNHGTKIQIAAPSMRVVTGETYSYDLHYSYQGDQPFNAIKMACVIPPGFAIKSATKYYSVSGNTISWNLGTLTKGDSSVRKITLQYNGTDKPGTVMPLTAELRNSAGTCNRATWPLIAQAQKGLTCKISSSSPNVKTGGSTLWTIEVLNQSAVPAADIKLLVNLPAKIEQVEQRFFSPSPPWKSAGSNATQPENFFGFSSGEAIYYYGIGNLNPGAKKVFQFRTWPNSSALDGTYFVLSANAYSENGVRGEASQLPVVLSDYFSSTPDIQVDGTTSGQTTAISFGNQRVGRSYSKKFRIRNLGALDLSVSKIKLSGTNATDWTIGSLTKKQFASRENSVFAVNFKPKGKGIRKATLTIYSNDPDEPTYKIKLTGKGL